MNVQPITTPRSPSLASPIFDASFDFVESLTTSFAASLVPTLETTTVTEVALGYHRNQQYSITAMTTSTGAVAERYAYTAYGQPTILNASGSVLTSFAVGNRYTYTGREWDETLGLHHFRARWMSPLAGRFIGRDPISFEGSGWDLYEFLEARAFGSVDPFGTDSFSSPNTPTTRTILQSIINEAIRLGAARDKNGCVRMRVSDYMSIRSRLFPALNIFPDPDEWNRGCIGLCQQNIRVKCTGCNIQPGGMPEQNPVNCFLKMPEDPGKVTCPKGYAPIIFSKQGKWKGGAPTPDANGNIPCDSVVGEGGEGLFNYITYMDGFWVYMNHCKLVRNTTHPIPLDGDVQDPVILGAPLKTPIVPKRLSFAIRIQLRIQAIP